MKSLAEDLASIQKSVFWCNENKIDLVGLGMKHYVWKPKNACHLRTSLKHDGGSIMCGCFSSVKTMKLVRVEGKVD